MILYFIHFVNLKMYVYLGILGEIIKNYWNLLKIENAFIFKFRGRKEKCWKFRKRTC